MLRVNLANPEAVMFYELLSSFTCSTLNLWHYARGFGLVICLGIGLGFRDSARVRVRVRVRARVRIRVRIRAVTSVLVYPKCDVQNLTAFANV